MVPHIVVPDRIRSVSILRDGNWKEIEICLSEIFESVSVRIQSVSILTCVVTTELNGGGLQRHAAALRESKAKQVFWYWA